MCAWVVNEDDLLGALARTSRGTNTNPATSTQTIALRERARRNNRWRDMGRSSHMETACNASSVRDKHHEYFNTRDNWLLWPGQHEGILVADGEIHDGAVGIDADAWAQVEHPAVFLGTKIAIIAERPPPDIA